VISCSGRGGGGRAAAIDLKGQRVPKGWPGGAGYSTGDDRVVPSEVRVSHGSELGEKKRQGHTGGRKGKWEHGKRGRRLGEKKRCGSGKESTAGHAAQMYCTKGIERVRHYWCERMGRDGPHNGAVKKTATEKLFSRVPAHREMRFSGLGGSGGRKVRAAAGG